MLRVKALIVGLVALGLTGIVLFATLHEQRSLPTPDAGASDVLASVPPPLTVAEEAYAAALWPIHSEIKVSPSSVMVSSSPVCDSLKPSRVR